MRHTWCDCGRDHAALIEARYEVTPEGCWQWTGRLAKGGYSTLSHRRNWLGHRLSWIAYRGPIPEGLELDHLCRNRACVNPDHLEPVTRAENMRRSDTPSAINARKVACPKGHPFTLTRDGRRTCRKCNVDRTVEWAKQVAPLEADDWRHGRIVGYVTYRCRCDPCRQAISDLHNPGPPRKLRARKGTRDIASRPDDPRHGTNNGYATLGCRCDRCKKAGCESSKARYYKRTRWNA